MDSVCDNAIVCILCIFMRGILCIYCNDSRQDNAREQIEFNKVFICYFLVFSVWYCSNIIGHVSRVAVR